MLKAAGPEGKEFVHFCDVYIWRGVDQRVIGWLR